MISAILSRVIILVFGTIYPAYCSYKAIRTKNVKEYVRWMMHWVVFSFFVTFETFSDVFISWIPFYYEVKLSIVFWLLSPMTKGSSILYKKFIHPKLSRHENEIDEYINQMKERGYKAAIDVGTKTFDYASKLIVETAIKATTSVVNMPRNRSIDVTDLIESSYSTRTTTPSPSPSFQSPSISDPEEPMHQALNNEFSDPEMEVEPVRARSTRSQSKTAEIPLKELPKKQARVKRGAKKLEPAQEQVRRRRRIHEEIIESEDE